MDLKATLVGVLKKSLLAHVGKSCKLAENIADDLIDDGHEERKGCVIVTEELAELLQLLVDKYTFAGVDNSWKKLCYYYDYLGPNG